MAEEQDLDSIMRIETQSFATPFDPHFFISLIQRKPFSLWVATVNAASQQQCVYGYVAVRLRGSWMDVSSVAVDERGRGRGIGRRLMERVVSLGKEMRVSHLRLHVSVVNHPAVTLYEHLGFVPVRWIHEYYHDEGHDAVEMVLSLG
jgi:ribosomal-protein-alanine N-acetyltransferase